MYDAEKFTVCGRTTSKVRINKNKVNSEEVEEKESRSERHYSKVRNQILKSPNRVIWFFGKLQCFLVWMVDAYPQIQKHSKTNFTTWSDSTSISNVTVWKLKATRRVAWSGAWR